MKNIQLANEHWILDIRSICIIFAKNNNEVLQSKVSQNNESSLIYWAMTDKLFIIWVIMRQVSKD